MSSSHALQASRFCLWVPADLIYCRPSTRHRSEHLVKELLCSTLSNNLHSNEAALVDPSFTTCCVLPPCVCRHQTGDAPIPDQIPGQYWLKKLDRVSGTVGPIYSIQLYCKYIVLYTSISAITSGQHGLPDRSPYATNCSSLCVLTPFYQNQH